MNKEYENLELFNNATGHRLEMQVGGQTVFIDYKLSDGKMLLLHTETPPELQGKGAATAIIEKAFAHIEKYGYRLVPICPFVTTYLGRHPEWKRLLKESGI